MKRLLKALAGFVEYHFLGIGISLIVVAVVCLVWISCIKNAEMINETYGTAYTASDMFWHGVMINQIIIGSKTRVLLENVSKK